MRTILLILVSITVLSCATALNQDTAAQDHSRGHSIASPGDYGRDVNWYTLAEGTKKARAESKPCVVDFFFPGGCLRCDRMDKYVYSNKEIIEKLNAEFVPILIDLSKPLSEEEKRLGDLYEYRKECLLLFMDSRGNIVEDPGGKKLCIADYVDAEWFLKYLDMAKKQ